MTREEWKALHKHLRERRICKDTRGFDVLRDSFGILGVTQKHENGHAIPSAAHANVLRMASFHRGMPEHHAIYMAKAKALRRFGTWFGRI